MDIQEILRNTLAASQFIPASARVRILRTLGLNLGAGTAVASGVMFKGAAVRTGVGCFLNHGVYVDRGELTMGDSVFVGPRAVFATRNHEIGEPNKRAGRNIDQPIIVGDGVWIGANAVILGGATIGAGCVIAAGAVVTKDTKPNSIYAGIPAVWVKDIE